MRSGMRANAASCARRSGVSDSSGCKRVGQILGRALLLMELGNAFSPSTRFGQHHRRRLDEEAQEGRRDADRRGRPRPSACRRAPARASPCPKRPARRRASLKARNLSSSPSTSCGWHAATLRSRLDQAGARAATHGMMTCGAVPRSTQKLAPPRRTAPSGARPRRCGCPAARRARAGPDRGRGADAAARIEVVQPIGRSISG